MSKIKMETRKNAKVRKWKFIERNKSLTSNLITIKNRFSKRKNQEENE